MPDQAARIPAAVYGAAMKSCSPSSRMGSLRKQPEVSRVQVLVFLVLAAGLFLMSLQLSPLNHLAASCSFTSRRQEEALDPAPTTASFADDGLSLKREFKAIGVAAALFVEMAAYRGGADTFAVVGLASKPAHTFGDAGFQCGWRRSSGGEMVGGRVRKMLPDWGYGRTYTVVVVNCTFEAEVGSDGGGGELVVTASYGEVEERFVAMVEMAGEYNSTLFQPPFRYQHVYCGSPLYGDLSPQRVREWLAYHAKLLGPSSHFVLYDAGGVHPAVRRVLEPWLRLGRITLHDVTAQEGLDGYYHNQFLIVNDCLFRSRFLSTWTHFFDLDEYLYVNPAHSLDSVLRLYSNYTQVFYEQVPVGASLCHRSSRKPQKVQESNGWAFEKLVYRNVKRVKRMRKYAVQARHVYSAGVHLTEDLEGDSAAIKASEMTYYHYHGTITNRGKICSNYSHVANAKYTVTLGKEPFRYDASMSTLAAGVREFELFTIGPQPFEE